jgi:hypothetical protein
MFIYYLASIDFDIYSVIHDWKEGGRNVVVITRKKKKKQYYSFFDLLIYRTKGDAT